MTWPAIYNGFPLLYPDSMSYLESGRFIAHGLIEHDFPKTYAVRAALYGLTIWPLHRDVTVWPIVAFNALLLAYVLWLVVRLFVTDELAQGVGGASRVYLLLGTFLGLFSGVAWYVGFIMPDIAGPVAYLSLFLITFGRRRLSRLEFWILVVIASWGITAHSTHLLLAASLCVTIPLVLWLQAATGTESWRFALKWVGGITLVAAAVQLAVNARLYGNPSLNGLRPPFLLARVVADGPGRWYLQRHCAEILRASVITPYICRDVDRLPDNVASFLWSPTGIWRNATAEQQDQLRQQELPIVAATVREYPWTELRISAAQWWGQLNAFGLYNYAADPFISEMFQSEFPNARATYERSRQAQETLPMQFFSRVQWWASAVSLLVILLLGWHLGRGWPHELAGLAAVVSLVVVFNAAITGAFSNIEDRYQARVIWLLPLLAAMVLLTWLARRDTMQPLRDK